MTGTRRARDTARMTVKQRIKGSVLNGGALLVTEEIPHLNSSIMGIYVKMGSDYEPLALNGISHLVEHMVFKGTEKRNAIQLSLDLENLGAIVNAYTSRDHTCFYFKSIPDKSAEIFDIFQNMVFSPLIAEDDLKKEKLVILEELKSAMDDPQDVVFQELNSIIFEGTEYAKPILGTHQSLASIKRDSVISFMNDYYGNSNVFIAYAGPLSHREVLSFADIDNFRNKARRIKKSKRICAQESVKKYIYKASLSQFHVAMGVKAADYSHRDKYPLILLTAMLGNGMSSRLFSRLREELGYVYNIYTFLEAFADSGVFGLYFACDPKNYSKSMKAIEDEFNKVRKGFIEDAEIKKVKNQILSSQMINYDTMSGRMGNLARSMLYTGEFRELQDMIRAIREVEKSDIIRVAKKYLITDKYNIAVTGNKKKPEI